MAGHFSEPRLYRTLERRWWWQGMYADAVQHAKNCPRCTVVGSTARVQKPPLPVNRIFQIVGVDIILLIMELPRTTQGNRYVVVFQDFLSKFPLVLPVPDQKSLQIAKLLVEEVVPLFGVPKALLSDRGANLLSHLMKEICAALEVKKLNVTAYTLCRVMVWLSSSTVCSRVCYGNMQRSMKRSGIPTCTESYELTGTHHMRVLGRNLHSCCTAMTVSPRLMLCFFLLDVWSQLQQMTTGRKPC